MINIAFVIDTIHNSTGGTEKQLLALINGLDRKRYNPFLIVLRSSKWLNEQKLPIPILDLNHRGTLARISVFRSLFAIASYCRKNKIEIVQTFFYDANILGTIGSRLSFRHPILISSRRNLGYSYGRSHLFILRLLRLLTDSYLANSRSAASHAEREEGINGKRLQVIYNGLDLSEFKRITPDLRKSQRDQWGLSESSVLVGAIANLRAVKNIPALIRAAACLIPRFPQLHFVAIGDGPERNNLESMICKMNLDNRFRLAGTIRDIIPWLASFDIAVLPSSSESFSNSIIEYMAAGLPVVASDVGGIGEAIEHGREGLLFPAGDDGRLVDCLEQLITKPSLANDFAERGRQKAFELFDLAQCIKNHEQYYETALSRRLG